MLAPGLPSKKYRFCSPKVPYQGMLNKTSNSSSKKTAKQNIFGQKLNFNRIITSQSFFATNWFLRHASTKEIKMSQIISYILRLTEFCWIGIQNAEGNWHDRNNMTEIWWIWLKKFTPTNINIVNMTENVYILIKTFVIF